MCEHEHHHNHPHQHGGEPGEELLILEYMLGHNRHHREELEGVAKKLEDPALAEVARLLSESLRLLDESNEALAKAISQWKGGA